MVKERDAQYSEFSPSEIMTIHGSIRDELVLLSLVRKLVIADRARQQAEKEKMIAELQKLLNNSADKWVKGKSNSDNMYYGGMNTAYSTAIQIIQGKEQKEEVSKE